MTGHARIDPTRSSALDFARPAFARGSADRDAILRTAFNHSAPLHVVRELFELPKRYYFSLDELAADLDRSAG